MKLFGANYELLKLILKNINFIIYLIKSRPIIRRANVCDF